MLRGRSFGLFSIHEMEAVLKRRAIVLVLAGMTLAGVAEQAAAASIDSVFRRVVAMDGVSPAESQSSTTTGYWGATVFQYSPSGLPPVSAANQGSFVNTIDNGATLLFAGSSQGGWGQVSTNVFRPGGSGISSLFLGFTVDTDASWSWYGAVVQSSGDGDFAAVTLTDVNTQATIFSDDSPGTFNISGSLTAGHDYLFSIVATAAFNRINSDGDSGFAEGVFRVSEVTTPVPEPESYAMMIAGLGVLGAIGRRRKRA